VSLDEASLDVAHFIAAVEDAEHRRRAEHRVELEEVLATVELLATRAQREQAISLIEDLAR
jgi:hypothetical protein